MSRRLDRDDEEARIGKQRPSVRLYGIGLFEAAAVAGEMIHEVVAAMAAHATVRDLAEAIHAFPNFAEGVKAAARQWVAGGQS